MFGGTSAPTGIPTNPPNPPNYLYFSADNPSGTKSAGCYDTDSDELAVDWNDNSVGDLIPCFDHNTLSDLLENNSLSWKYYAEYLDNIWVAPNGIKHICEGPNGQDPACTYSDFENHVQTQSQNILTDLSACTLSNVTWVVPPGQWSDHPGFQNNENNSIQIEGGPAWVASIVNALGNSQCKDGSVSYWDDTVIFVVWDDWGGWYDHIKLPPGMFIRGEEGTWGSGYVYGFRVPLLVISAYTGTNQNGNIVGYVSGACTGTGNCQNNTFPYQHDFGSILAFIEWNFLGPTAIGQINPQFEFADGNAPDYERPPNLHVPLIDFFPLYPTPRQFVQIGIPPGQWQNFNFTSYTGPYDDPDNDVIDDD